MAVHASIPALLLRRRWHVTGQVQGVGFRPFVYRLACTHGLTGFVRNTTDGVAIECQGTEPMLDAFQSDLQAEAPPLVRVASLSVRLVPSVDDEHGFRIENSDLSTGTAGAASVDVTVDSAVCPDCLGELRDPADRRHGYGLINCTNCGPRYSIVRGVPYDRPNTTMAGFALCPACAAEYHAPADRRFHAQPVACHTCGPQVSLHVLGRDDETPVDPRFSRRSAGTAPAPTYRRAAELLRAGQIVAIKGLGGFHLAVRADDAYAVRRLRTAKHRDAKPFALMCATLDEARRLVELSNRAAAFMRSPACPIVLARRRPGVPLPADVAPESHRLGVMLPYTPIHHLLFDALAAGADPIRTLVMTSANVTDEPLIIDNADAVARLGSTVGTFLWHDRPIQRGVDDSVFIDVGPAAPPLPIRRARGLVPAPVALPVDGPAGLSVGGELKNTIAVSRGGQAILSHHLGDLGNARAYGAFKDAARDLRELFAVKPAWVAHDLHPQYLSTTYARQLARELNVPTVAVQHHHAHAAAVLAEHGLSGSALAVVCDGTGYGDDGTIWGGELLLADLTNYTRLARLAPLQLAGGDTAARDTRRCAMAMLYQAFGNDFADLPAARRLVPAADQREMLARMIRQRVSCATSSGAGRYFDGLAALIGACDRNTFEGRAGMAVESLAARVGQAACDDARDLFTLHTKSLLEIDLTPFTVEVVESLGRKPDAPALAAAFHEQFARAWVAAVRVAAERTGLQQVALSGGVFCNERLTGRLTELLTRAGFAVLRHEQVPPNDGGLSLGQAAVATARAAAGMVDGIPAIAAKGGA